MRKPINPQMQLGEIGIGSIQFDLDSRDDIPCFLREFQHLYANPERRQAVFTALEKMIPASVDKNNGRPGMDLWRILVFGSLRVELNCDFDRSSWPMSMAPSGRCWVMGLMTRTGIVARLSRITFPFLRQKLLLKSA